MLSPSNLIQYIQKGGVFKLNSIKFGIKGIDDDLFSISNVNKIIAYPYKSELQLSDLALDDHTSLKFFYSDFPDEQGSTSNKQLIVKTSDIIYMKVKN